MAEMTPPTSQQGTPVRHVPERQAPAADTDLIDLGAGEVEDEPDKVGETSSDARQTGAEDGSANSDEELELDMNKTDGSDVDEGMDQDDPGAVQEIKDEDKGKGLSGMEEKKDDATLQKRASKPSAASRSSKGNKKDNTLFDSEIVARWNRDIGDIFAAAPTTKA